MLHRLRLAFAALLILATIPARAGLPQVQGLWQLDGNLFDSISGLPAKSLTATGFSQAFISDTIGEQPASALQVPAFSGASERLTLPVGTGGNGGGSYLNQWSLVMDVRVDGNTLPAKTPLLQTNTSNSNDADVHITSTGNLYLNGIANAVTPDTQVAASTWTRIAVTCGNKSGGPLTVCCFINGVKVFENANEGRDGTYSLDTTVHLFSNDNGRSATIFCNSVGFWRETLSELDIAALGGASAAGITPFVVTNTNDSGPGSLRQAVADAANATGAATITLASTLSGQTISLGSEIVLDSDVTLDATSLAAGLTINDGTGINYRLFSVSSGKTVTLCGLTLANGGGPAFSVDGGAILNAGTLTLTQCTLSGNSDDVGVNGAIYNDNSGQLTLKNSIVAGNSPIGAGSGADIYNHLGTITRVGANVVQSLINSSGTVTGPAHITDPPLLAPLANNGGPTKTHALLPGSPAINNAVSSAITSDQRGQPLFGTADIGAYERQLGPIAASTTTNENTATAALPFTVGTVGTLSASSNNQALVPNGNITLGGNGANRTVTLSPAADQNGSATITMTDSLSGETQTFTLNVTPVNDAPSFTKGADQNLPVGSGAQSIANWATGITDGDPELNQTLSVIVTNNNNALFTAQPVVDAATGTLSFTPSDIPGIATVSVSLQDDGSGTPPDVNTSVQTFSITVVPLTTAVSNTSDSGPGSLRQALLNAATNGGPDTITLAPSFTGPIVLSSEIVIDSDVTVDGGTGFGGGGAIFNNGTLTLRRCTLSGNSSPFGGAIFNESGVLLMEQCTLAANTSNAEAGALWNRGTATLRFCTVAGNSANSFGGILNDGARTLTLENTLVRGNTGADAADIFNRPTGTLACLGASIVSTAINGGSTVNGSDSITTADPLLAPLANNGGPTQTMALLPGSPAIDAATVIGGLTTDQRGFDRNRDGDGTPGALPDIGAYEAQAAPTAGNANPIVVTTTTDEQDAPGTPGAGVSLRDAPAGCACGFHHHL